MLVEQITAQLINAGNPDIAQHSQRFFKTAKGEYGEGDKFIGIRIPVLRQTLKLYQNATLKEALVLLKHEYHEIRLFAVLLLVQLFEQSKKDEAKQSEIVKAYLANTHYINRWDIVDSSAHKILGKFYLNRNKSILHQLALSSHLWERRMAMMSTYTFIKNHQFDDALILAEILLHDKHDLIHKIVGWMLREVGNKNKQVAERFLQKHYQNMPRTMLRYAIEKFTKVERTAYLKGQM
ncbi:DNA alkylation repair protein [Thalassotalea sp. SU-HH00458]|uniref:DNA alkylation repair protein n=1 Tax=Thalassotalea sp. SU-HH00458 TaxID=3127657 RepID=UPI003105EEC6